MAPEPVEFRTGLRFFGAPLFAMSAKGGWFCFFIFLVAITTKKKAGLNLSPARLLSKLCYDSVLVGCHPRAELLARLRSGRGRVELRRFRRTFERGC